MDLCHLKNAEFAKHLQKYKERVVLRGGNVKDEEGYSIHRARCFSVSAKFLDTISKFFGWRNTWRDLNVHSSPRWPKLQNVTNAERRMSWHLDQNSSTTKTKRLGQKWRPLCTSCKELVWSPTSRPSLGKKLWKKCFFKKEMGGKYQLGNVFTRTRSSDDSYRYYVDDILKWLDRSKTWILCGKLCNKTSTAKIQRRWWMKCIQVARKGSEKVDPQAVQSKNRVVQEIDDDKAGWRKWLIERKHLLEKSTAWNYDAEGHAEKGRWKDTVNRQKKMYLLSNKWRIHAFSITWYHWKTMKQHDVWTEAVSLFLKSRLGLQDSRSFVLEGYEWVGGWPPKIQKTTKPDSNCLEAWTQLSNKQEEKGIPERPQECRTASSVPQRRNLRGTDRRQGSPQGDCWCSSETGKRQCSCYAVHCEGQSREAADLHRCDWCQPGTVRFRKYRSMRKREATPCGPHRRRRICGKFSQWHGAQASFCSWSFENTRSRSRSG